MRNCGIPFTYTKAYGVQSEISHVTVTRVAGQEVDFHRNVNTYHRDMMFKINSLCREQKRLKEYGRKLQKRKRKSSELIKEREAATLKANNGNQSQRNQEDEEESKTIEMLSKDEPMDVANPCSEDKSHSWKSVLETPDDEKKSPGHDSGCESPDKLQTKMEHARTNENSNSKRVVIIETLKETESDKVATLLSGRHENEQSFSRASCEISLEVLVRRSGRSRSTSIVPSITSQRDRGFILDGTPEQNTRRSPVRINKKAGLRSKEKGPLQEISTNLIKLQYTSNYKLLCRLVDTMAHRQIDKDVLGNKQNMIRSDRHVKPFKPGLDQGRLKEQEIENPNVSVDSLPRFWETGVEKHRDGIISGSSRHSSRPGPQSSSDVPHMTKVDMTRKRVLPPISEKRGTNSVRHDINRYLNSVSPVDPLLKQLSRYERVKTVTWKSAFASLKNLKCL